MLQAIPHYFYLVMVAPKSISYTITNIQRNFLWRGSEKKQKWALVSWEKVCKPKRKAVSASGTLRS